MKLAAYANAFLWLVNSALWFYNGVSLIGALAVCIAVGAALLAAKTDTY